jgi:hypothetical protein
MNATTEFCAACARVDDVLRPLALAAAPNGRSWSGAHDGRNWTVDCTPQRRTRYHGEARVRATQGYRLRVTATTTVPMRLYVVESRFATSGIVGAIYRMRRFAVLFSEIDGMQTFRIVTQDPDWARMFLDQPRVAASLIDVVEHRDRHGQSSSLWLDPGKLCYTSPLRPPAEVDAASTNAAIDALIFLAREAERLPPPSRPARLNRLEHASRANPALAAILIVFGLMAVLGIAGVLFSLLLLGAGKLVFG